MFFVWLFCGNVVSEFSIVQYFARSMQTAVDLTRIFTHEELSAHAHNIVQEVEVQDGFFLAVKKTILCCSFLTLVANK